MTLLCVLIVTSHRFLDFIDIKPDSSTCSNHFIQFFNFFTHHFSLPPKQFENNSPHTSHDITPSIHDWFQNTLILLQNNHLNAFFFCFFVFVFLNQFKSPLPHPQPHQTDLAQARKWQHISLNIVYVLFFPNQKEIHKNSKLFKNISLTFPPSLSLSPFPFTHSKLAWRIG